MSAGLRRALGRPTLALAALIFAVVTPRCLHASDPVPIAPIRAPIVIQAPAVNRASSARELDAVLTNNKATQENKERLAAKLRGEESLYDAAKLTGQARLDFLERAARRGDPAAAERLGEIFDSGEHVHADRARAAGYFRAAALGGREGAAHFLGLACSAARGVPRDYREALAWLIVAKARGDDSDLEQQLRTFLSGSQYRTLVGAAEDRAKELQAAHKPEEIVAALPPAAPIEFAAESDAPTVTYRAGTAVAEMPDTPPEVVVYTVLGTRLAWQTVADLRREADRGDPAALDAWGRVLLAGKLVAPDALLAAAAFERGAKAGDLDAAYQLSSLYSVGADLVQDDARAFAYCQQAARGGVVPAMVNLGVFYTNGRGIERDLVTGFAWLCVAKHFGENSGQERQLRVFLTRNNPDNIAKAEALAAKLMAEVQAKMR